MRLRAASAIGGHTINSRAAGSRELRVSSAAVVRAAPLPLQAERRNMSGTSAGATVPEKYKGLPFFPKQYINGEWVLSTNTESFIDVFDSNTGEVCAGVADGTVADTKKAVEAAAAAFPSWSRLSLNERKAHVQAILEHFKTVQPRMVEMLGRELGAPKFLAEVQAGLLPAHFKSNLKLVDQIEWRKELGNSTILKEPIGVVGCITPWNWPLNQIAAKCGPALLAGCTVVLKPSEVTPVNALLLAEAVHAAGLPRGVFNVIVGKGPACGEILATHPKVDMVSFTGSTGVGRLLHGLGATTIKRVRTELGGKSALIVLDDAPKDDMRRMATNVLGNTGQSCNALTRMLVPQPRYEETVQIMKAAFEKARVVDAREAGSSKPGDIGPLASMQQYEKVRRYIAKGVEEGARLVTGGLEHPEGCPKTGFFVKPTVFADVNNSMTVAQEEIFGPVLCIIPYGTEEEAIAIANDTIYGLSNGVVSADVDRAMRVASQLRSGQVSVNSLDGNLMAPFGGYKQSGDGREWGTYGIEEFLQVKAINKPRPQAKAKAKQ